jgi:hypothetical protein
LDNLTDDYNGGANGLQCLGILANDTAGADRTYEIILAAGDWLTVWLTPQGFNGVVYLLDGCAGATCAVGADEARAGPSRERLDYVALSAGTYYLVVDGDGGQGNYSLQVDQGTIADYDFPALGDLIFTEVHPAPSDPGGGDACEWLEIANPGTAAVLFHGAQLHSPAGSYLATRPLVVQPQEHVVFARHADQSLNCGLDWVSRAYGGSGAGGFDLCNPSACLLEIEFNSTIIDDIDYQGGGSWPYAEGQSMYLCTNRYDHSDNDSSGNWLTTPASSAHAYDDAPPPNHGTPRLAGPSACP